MTDRPPFQPAAEEPALRISKPRTARSPGAVALRLLLLAYTLLSALSYVGGALTLGPFAARSDFVNFYTAGVLVRAGASSDLYNTYRQREIQAPLFRAAGIDPPAAGQSMAYLLPPFAAPAFVPFSLLPLDAAYAVWTVLCIVALAEALWLAATCMGWRIWERALATALGLAYFPAVGAVILGQVSPILVLLLALFSRALLRGRYATAGIWLGLALFKPQYALFHALFAAIERRSTLVRAGLVGAGCALASLALIGPNGIFDYAGYLLQITAPQGVPSVSPQAMVNWRGVASRLLIERDARLIWPATLVADALTISLLVAIWLQARGNGAERKLLRLSAIVPAALLVSPHTNLHDASLLVLSGCWIAELARRQHVNPRLAWGLLAVAHLSVLVSLLAGPRAYADLTVGLAAATLGLLLQASTRKGLTVATRG